MLTSQMTLVGDLSSYASSSPFRASTLVSAPKSPSPFMSTFPLNFFDEYCGRRFSRRRTKEQKPLLASMEFRSSQPMVILCSGSNAFSSNYLTEMGLYFPFFQEIGLEEREAEVLFHKNPLLRSASLEFLRTRLLSLRSVGIDGFSLCRLITKRPDVLTAEEIGPLLCFVRDELEGQIEPLKLERLLTVTDPQFFVGFSGKVTLLLDHGIPRQELANVLNNVNLTKVFCYKPAKELERTLLFLDRFGGVDLIIRRPGLLNLDLQSQLVPRIRFLTELSGEDENATATVLRKLPAILTYSVEHLQGHAEFLRSFVGLTDHEIFRIVLVYPNIFSVSKERKLRPRIEFLKQCGLSSNDIFKFLIKAPLFLSLSFEENLSKKLGFLVKIGYENGTKELALAMGAVTRTSSENMQKVIGVLLSYGLTCDDILAMSKKHPQILQYNHDSLEKKLDYLIEEMGREIGELLAFPAFLGYKLEDRIKHRYEVKKKTIGTPIATFWHLYSWWNPIIPVKQAEIWV